MWKYTLTLRCIYVHTHTDISAQGLVFHLDNIFSIFSFRGNIILTNVYVYDTEKAFFQSTQNCQSWHLYIEEKLKCLYIERYRAAADVGIDAHIGRSLKSKQFYFQAHTHLWSDCSDLFTLYQYILIKITRTCVVEQKDSHSFWRQQ